MQGPYRLTRARPASLAITSAALPRLDGMQ